MRAELIAVGTELLLGETLDTNTAWLAADLADRGVDVLWSQRVGDNLGRVVEALRCALARNDLVVVCGGLGPTADDLTREAVCALLDEQPAIDPSAERTLRAWFQERARPLSPSNLKQAWIIPSAELLPNHAGTAPGWLVRVDGRVLVTLPGPPAELQTMWRTEALPRLHLGLEHLARLTLKTWGAGESAIADRLGDLALAANPSVATYAREDGVHVRVAAKAADPDSALALLAPVAQAVEDLLRDCVWGRQEDSLVGCIQGRLRQSGWTLCTLESLTGGAIGDLITRHPGVSTVYRGGGVAYSADCKIRFGVPAALLEAHGTVAPETAQAMAQASATWFGADVALAITGVAGPDTVEGQPPGTAFVAVHTPCTRQVRRLSTGARGRNVVREAAAWSALHLLREVLTEG